MKRPRLVAIQRVESQKQRTTKLKASNQKAPRRASLRGGRSRGGRGQRGQGFDLGERRLALQGADFAAALGVRAVGHDEDGLTVQAGGQPVAAGLELKF